MTRRVDSEAGLERIWRTAILPLLEEHYFGQGRDLDKEFGLAALSRAVDVATEEQASPP
jgi:5-methylcytosine-specific restriction protein B